jgi:hypothetical protein
MKYFASVEGDDTGTPKSRMIRLDNMRFSSGVALQATVQGSFGNSSFSVQYSFDDPNDLISPVPVDQMQWFSDFSPFVAVNESGSGMMPVAPLYVRIAMEGTSGGVNLTMTQYRRSFPLGASSPAPPFSLPGIPAGVFSTRKVVASFNGPALTARRASDNTTEVINYLANGDIDDASLSAFGSGTILFCAALSDQSGAGFNVTQVNAGAQPQLLKVEGRWYLACGAGQGLVSANAGDLALTGDQTIIAVCQCNSDNSQIACSATDQGTGWVFWMNGVGGQYAPGPNPRLFTYFSFSGNPVNASSMMTQMPNICAITRTSGVVQTYMNGVAGASLAGISNSVSTGPFTISGFAGGYSWEGLIGEIVLYSSARPPTDLSAIFANQAAYFPSTGFATPASGSHWLQYGVNQYVNLGDVLNWEHNQAWTVFVPIQLTGANQPAAGLIWTNVPASTDNSFPGWEGWVDENGRWRVRIISNIGANNYIGTISLATVAQDGAKHMMAIRYLGNSLAAGVTVFVDGAAIGMSVEADTLTGSIIGSGQSFLIGNQQGDLGFNARGCVGRFQVDNVARSDAYIQAISTAASIPPIDANTVLCLPFAEGSGTTTADISPSGFNGTLTSATMWVPG